VLRDDIKLNNLAFKSNNEFIPLFTCTSGFWKRSVIWLSNQAQFSREISLIVSPLLSVFCAIDVFNLGIASENYLLNLHFLCSCQNGDRIAFGYASMSVWTNAFCSEDVWKSFGEITCSLVHTISGKVFSFRCFVWSNKNSQFALPFLFYTLTCKLLMYLISLFLCRCRVPCLWMALLILKLFRLRSQVESAVAERDALKENLSKFTEEKEMLIVESEDTAQKLEKLHETKMRWEFRRVRVQILICQLQAHQQSSVTHECLIFRLNPVLFL